MSQAKTANTIDRQRVEDLAIRHGEAAWLKESRLAAWETYLTTPMPTQRDSEWKRTNLSALDPAALTTLDFNPAANSLPQLPDWFKPVAAANEKRSGLIYSEALGSTYIELSAALAEKGVIFTDMATAIEKHADKIRPYLAERAKSTSKFTLLNQALFNCGLFLYIPQGVEVVEPFVSGIGLSGKASGTAGGAIFPRLIVVAEDNSKACLVNAFGSTTGPGALSLMAGHVEMHLGRGAKLSYLEVQRLGGNVLTINRSLNEIASDAEFTALTVALGSGQTKGDIETILNGPGARSTVLGVVVGGSDEHFNFNTIQEHNATDTKSDINFRVALKGSATSTYQGIIRVAKVAQRTDAFQSNKNLLLGLSARADSIPKLEILADDVKCSHGATVGPIDRDQVFYLMSRGLTREESEQLIVIGFFKQILEQFGNHDLDWVNQLISSKVHA